VLKAAGARTAVTPEHVLSVVRSQTAHSFPTDTGKRFVLLASLGLDLGRGDVRAALLELHRRGDLQLVRISAPGFQRADIGPQGLRYELVEESALREGELTYHGVVLLK
jgi:hypothetical protein